MSESVGTNRRSRRTVGWMLLLGVFIAAAWYVISSDYSYDAISGTYSQSNTTETSTLVLSKDQTFEQEVNLNGNIERANGEWRRIGEGRVVFSPEFIGLPSLKRRSDRQVDAEVKKTLGLLPQLVFDDQPGGPIFHRHLSR